MSPVLHWPVPTAPPALPSEEEAAANENDVDAAETGSINSRQTIPIDEELDEKVRSRVSLIVERIALAVWSAIRFCAVNRYGFWVSLCYLVRYLVFPGR